MNQPARKETGLKQVSKVLRIMLLLIGASLIAIPIGLDLLAGQNIRISKLDLVSIAVGLVYLILGCLLLRLPSFFLKASLLLVAVAFFVGITEATGRILGFDFGKTQAKWESTPIYYRQPTKPIGEVYFHRPGPDSWTGRVLSTELLRIGIQEVDAYPDERKITVRYDQSGFRNPPDLKDWRVVMIGDSFTELGYLPDSDLFTSQIAQKLDCRVKNLGVSYTGMLSYCCFLNEFGISKSTSDAVIVFFEGNDWKDTKREFEALQKFNETGEREFREIQQHRQTSFIRAFVDLATNLFFRRQPKSAVNAAFLGGATEIELTLISAPPNQNELSEKTKSGIQLALQRFAATTKQHKIRPWLVYMPCKRRALDGYLKFLDSCDPVLANWTPSNLPNWMRSQCAEYDIQFIDLTPSFRKKSAEGILLYNHIYDTHLNRFGSLLVAKLIADAIKLSSPN